MPRIQTPDIGEKIRQRFNVVGIVDVDTIAPEVVPVVLVDDLSTGVERLAAIGSHSMTPNAGEKSNIALFNESDDVIVRVYQIMVWTPGANGTVYLGKRDVADGIFAGASTIYGWQDRRAASADPLARVLFQSDPNSLVDAIAQIAAPTISNTIYPMDVVLEPGKGFGVATAASDVSLAVVFWWTESDQ